MRFVSKSANFHAGNYRNGEEVLGPTQEWVVGGQRKHNITQTYTVRDPLAIAFSQDGLLQIDIDVALAQWKRFPGLPMEEDEVTPANPVENGRIGVWDSVAWQQEHGVPDEDREGAENLLLNSRFYGVEFIVVEEVKAQKPWPKYDDVHHTKVAALAAELGCAAEALAYERENKNRPTVIEQLEAAVAEAESGEFVAA